MTSLTKPKFSREFDELFNMFSKQSFYPPHEVVVREDALNIDFVVPGRDKEDFQVEVVDGNLVVSSQAETSKREGRLRSFNSQSFKKIFALSNDLNQDGVKAVYKDGILTVSLLIKKEDRPTSLIPVN